MHARYIDEIWCLDLAKMDKLPQCNRGINSLLVIVDIFAQYLWVEILQRKGAEAVKVAFSKMFETKELNFPKSMDRPRKTVFGDLNIFCEYVGVNYYHNYSETKVAFGERALRTLKHLNYRYLEKIHIILHQRPRKVNSRINWSTGLATKDVVNTEFWLSCTNKRIYEKIQSSSFK